MQVIRDSKRAQFFRRNEHPKRKEMRSESQTNMYIQRTFSQSRLATCWLTQDTGTRATENDCLSVGENGCDGKAS
jgi:hypothetical protein